MKPLRSINLNLLPILRELLINESVSHAAEILNMSQSATSEALGRLRHMFDDPLLVQHGRQMQRTPFASQLLPAIEEAVQSLHTLFRDPYFDPAKSERSFRIGTADCLLFLFGAPLLEGIGREAPGLEMEFCNVSTHMINPLEKGVMDFIVAPEGFLPAEDPGFLKSELLFEIDFVGIACQNNKLADDNMDIEEYRKLSHVVYHLEEKSWTSLEAQVLSSIGVEQYNLAFVQQFMLMPFLLKNTNAVAIVQRYIAEIFKDLASIKTFTPPVPMSNTNIFLYWSSISERDPAHSWMRNAIIQAARGAYRVTSN